MQFQQRQRTSGHAKRREFYDCNGNCLNDADSDGICNEFEIAGCTFSDACNYDPEARTLTIMHLR